MRRDKRGARCLCRRLRSSSSSINSGCAHASFRVPVPERDCLLLLCAGVCVCCRSTASPSVAHTCRSPVHSHLGSCSLPYHLSDRSLLRHTGWVYFHFLFLYSGLEFTLCFLTHLHFSYSRFAAATDC